MFAVRGDHVISLGNRSRGLEDGAPIVTDYWEERVVEERRLLASFLGDLQLLWGNRLQNSRWSARMLLPRELLIAV